MNTKLFKKLNEAIEVSKITTTPLTEAEIQKINEIIFTGDIFKESTDILQINK